MNPLGTDVSIRVPAIPSCKSELTVEWLGRALRAGGLEGTEHIRSVAVEQIGVGVGLLARLYRCRLTTSPNAEQIPKSVVVKLPTDNRENLKIIRKFELYKREYDFFDRIQDSTDIPTPRIHYRCFRKSDGGFVLVMQDFSHLECVDQIEGAAPWQAKLAVKRLAELHAPFWNAKQKLPRGAFYNTLRTKSQLLLQLGFQFNLDATLKRYGEYFNSPTRKTVREFGESLAMYATESGVRLDSFAHNDYRVENMFFGNEDSGEFAVIDWQVSGWNAALYDVAYFLGSSTDSRVRREVERDAVRGYSDALSRLLGTDLDHEEIWRHYRFGMLLALVIPVITCGAIAFPNERAERMASLGLERTLTAIEELESGELLHSMIEPTLGARLKSRTLTLFHRVTHRVLRL